MCFLPSSLVDDAWGRGRVAAAAAAAARSRVALVTVDGGVDPGARVGNLRTPSLAAFEPDAPMITEPSVARVSIATELARDLQFGLGDSAPCVIAMSSLGGAGTASATVPLGCGLTEACATPFAVAHIDRMGGGETC